MAMANENGFADMATKLGTLAKVTEKVTMESLEDAAIFYMDKLIPYIPVSLLKKKHAKDHVKVEVKNDEVVVIFEDTAYYWRFPENGSANQKAQHFASGTFEQHKQKIEELMVKRILNEGN